jgi:hypothetical protein
MTSRTLFTTFHVVSRGSCYRLRLGCRRMKAPKQPPKNGFPGYPEVVALKRKSPVRGVGLRKRWRELKTGNIRERDSQHGCLEVYDSRGKHLGEFDINGVQLKEANPRRRIEP